MNQRLIGVFVFALVIAGLFTFVWYKLVGGASNKEAKPVPTVQVWAASRDLSVGSLVQPADVTAVAWPGAIPQGAAQKTGDVCPWVGRGVTTRVFQGEPFVEGRMAPKGALGGLAALIPNGFRAVPVRVDEIRGVAGFVGPGQIVDVLISGTPPGGSPGAGNLSKTLLQKVRVLSAGQNLEKDPEGKPISVTVVTLLVDPKDAETLSLASSETKIQLVLRNPSDEETAKTPGTSVSSLFSGVKYNPAGAVAEQPKKPQHVAPAVVVPVVKEPPPVTVEVIQGDTRSTVKFTEASR
jgi:pilus assembly protein CpaB